MANQIPLSEFMKNRTQTDVAKKLGVTQGGLRKMIVSGRNIHIEEKKDGGLRAFETREVPVRRACIENA